MYKFTSDIVINVAKEISAHGGRAYLVGGIPRDCVITNNHNWRNVVNMLGSDIDIEVFGMSFVILENLIRPFFSKVDMTGKRFGVLIAFRHGKKFDFSVAKRERQVGIGHQGFEYDFDPNMTITEACSRRDYTINAMAIDPLTSELIDPMNGAKAIAHRKLIACSVVSFADDPLRVMRGMQMCGRFGLQASYLTAKLARSCIAKFDDLSREAVWGEMKKWALKSIKPSFGLTWLHEIGWLDDIPILGQYKGVVQDSRHHPEGWSHEFDTFSIEPPLASSTESIGIDESTSEMAEFFATSLAQSAMIPPLSCAKPTQSLVNCANGSLDTTKNAGSFRATPLSEPIVTIITKPKSFMWARDSPASTIITNKCLRIVLKVPFPRMASIMKSTVNDFEIIKRIIHPVVIYMMDMLPFFKGSSEVQLHKESMESNTAATLPIFRLGEVDILISSIVANFESVAIDNNVLLNFDLALEDDFNFHEPYDTTELLICKIRQGGLWEHTLCAINYATTIAYREQLEDFDKLVLVFAALLHDCGKINTTEITDGRITTYGHGVESGYLAEKFFFEYFNEPDKKLREHVVALVSNHMAHIRNQGFTRKAVRKLSRRIQPSNLQMLAYLMECDYSARPPLKGGMPEHARMMLELAKEEDIADNAVQPILMGRHIILMGLKPSPKFGKMLEIVFDAQLDGKFHDLDSCYHWVANNNIINKVFRE